ncbi:hypothetical protein B0H13DRAFT_2354172 [Mycena leptocephala]|nr:hypothetical protein B0H13DRAFT_2354172 [Mycena leptocephala]
MSDLEPWPPTGPSMLALPATAAAKLAAPARSYPAASGYAHKIGGLRSSEQGTGGAVRALSLAHHLSPVYSCARALGVVPTLRTSRAIICVQWHDE